jgi:hypothetical protein
MSKDQKGEIQGKRRWPQEAQERNLELRDSGNKELLTASHLSFDPYKIFLIFLEDLTTLW